MRIVSFDLTGPHALRVTFQDGSQLDARFDSALLVGASANLRSPDTFAQARLVHGTVGWDCGLAIDAELARIKADAASVWCLCAL